jgi:hypothetical protein
MAMPFGLYAQLHALSNQERINDPFSKSQCPKPRSCLTRGCRKASKKLVVLSQFDWVAVRGVSL